MKIWRYGIDIYYTDGTTETRNVKSETPVTLPQLKAHVMRKFTPRRLADIREIKAYEKLEGNAS